jgi:hypothetical protein
VDSQNWPISNIGVDADTGGLVVIDSAHYMLHQGRMFSYQEAATLASAGTKEFLIAAPATGEIHMQLFADSLFELTLDFYKASTRNGASEKTPNNRKQVSTRQSTIKLYSGLGGGGADGTLLFSYKNGDPATSKIQGIGVNTGDRDEWILAPSVKYLVRLTSGADANNTNTLLRWYEVD